MKMYIIATSSTGGLATIRYADVRQAILVFFDLNKVIHFTDCFKRHPLVGNNADLDLIQFSIFGKEQMVESIQSTLSESENKVVDIFFQGDSEFTKFFDEVTEHCEDKGLSVHDVFKMSYVMEHPSMSLT